MAPIPCRGDNCRGTAGLGRDGIHSKCVLGKNRFITGRKKGACDQVQYIVGAITQGDGVSTDAQLGGQGLLKQETITVGVTGQIGFHRIQCAQHLRAGPQGILVAGQLDNIAYAQLTLKLCDGFTGYVRSQPLHAGSG